MYTASEGLHNAAPLSISNNKYGQFWLTMAEQQFITFKVQACAEAHIALTNIKGLVSSHAFEIRLGENENAQSSIYSSNGNENCHTSEGSLLSCTEYVFLWLSWSDGFIKLGSGQSVGNNVVLNCEVDEFAMRAVSLASEKGNDATWIFEEVLGQYMCCVVCVVVQLRISPPSRKFCRLTILH